MRITKRASLAAVATAGMVSPLLSTGHVGAQDSAAVPAPAQAAAADGAAPTYTVTFRNLTPGQYLTPPNFAAHDRSVDVFSRGGYASPGVQAVAENGGVPVLAAELAAAIDDNGLGTSGVGAEAPIPPGQEVTFEFTSDETHLSVVSMLICTNDGFAGLDARQLPRRDGQNRTYLLRGYDAGTEINTERHTDLVPAPFCGGDGVGTDQSNPELAENRRINRHRGIRGVGDLPSSFDWNGPVAEVEILRTDPTPSYTITVENLTSGQYLTPPNFAAHDRSVDVFQRHQPASPGVQAVAENGGVPVLAAELAAAIDDNGLGVSGVGGDAPIAPGESVTFEVTSRASHLSIVSMLICTNDGFAGLDTRRLPRWPGDSLSYHLRDYDAGTEINTERHADLVPAPFCGGDGVGTDQSNPELAEHGVIRNHRGIRGVGDLGPDFNWFGPVAKVTIVRH